MKTQKNYYILDIFKFLFACLIVLMHINFNNSRVVFFITQYISRIGVPFFMVCSGFLLANKINMNTHLKDKEILIKFIKRTSYLFIVWTILYLPYNIYTIYISNMDIGKTIIYFIREVLFKAPSYLWYLMAIIIASIPYVLLFRKKFKIYMYISLLLFFIGTVGNSYKDLIGIDIDLYYKIFMTTRNGVFFAPIFLGIGGCIANNINQENNTDSKLKIYHLILMYIFFCIEVTFIKMNVSYKQDTSMYFTMPILLYVLFENLLKIKCSYISIDICKLLRSLSLIIYTSQFGFILLYSIISKIIFYKEMPIIIYISTIVSSYVLTIVIIKLNNKYLNRLL